MKRANGYHTTSNIINIIIWRTLFKSTTSPPPPPPPSTDRGILFYAFHSMIAINRTNKRMHVRRPHSPRIIHVLFYYIIIIYSAVPTSVSVRRMIKNKRKKNKQLGCSLRPNEKAKTQKQNVFDFRFLFRWKHTCARARVLKHKYDPK